MSSDPAAPTAALEAQLLLDTFRGIDLGVVWLDEQACIVLANDHFAGWARTDVGLDSSDIRRVRYHAGLLLPTPSVVSVVREVERLDTLNKLTAAAKCSLIVCGGRSSDAA